MGITILLTTNTKRVYASLDVDHLDLAVGHSNDAPPSRNRSNAIDLQRHITLLLESGRRAGPSLPNNSIPGLCTLTSCFFCSPKVENVNLAHKSSELHFGRTLPDSIPSGSARRGSESAGIPRTIQSARTGRLPCPEMYCIYPKSLVGFVRASRVWRRSFASVCACLRVV